jgi:CDP-paratose 2-epimerase
VCYRGGCLTGPTHSGAELHGFLAYLARAVREGRTYRIYGYGGKQVRDNIHSADLVRAFAAFHASPRAGAVYNIGGGRENSCSMREAITLCEQVAGRELDWELGPDNRVGDHRWWISDLTPFISDYPGWRLEHDLPRILREIHEANVDSWTAVAG